MFEDVTQEDVLAAIKSLSESGNIRDTQYGVWFHGNTYSPAGIISEVYRLRDNPIHRRTFTTDVAQKRLLELGFPIVEIGNDFFSEKELYSFGQLVKRPVYDSENVVDNNIGDFLNQVIWEKTIAWAKGLESLGWEIDGSKHWNARDRKGQHFRNYTWFRIYPKKLRNDLLCFTIGVDSDGSLLYKLDIKEKDPFFTKERIDFFREERRRRKVRWQTIEADNVANESWKSLVPKSHKFFLNHLQDYEYFVNIFWPAGSRLMRLTWNTNNWETPSGHPWQKKYQGLSNKAYENQYGYGHEEWLFNERYRIKEYQYGYIRGVDHMSENEESIGRVVLFTINPDSKLRLLVGEIRNVQIIEGDDIEINKFMPCYEEYYDTMVEELKEVKADYRHFKNEGLLPNVKFKWEDVVIYNEPIVSSYLNSDKYKRFQPYIIDEEIDKLLDVEIEKVLQLDFQSGVASSADSYLKNTSGKQTTVTRRHSRITNDLNRYLQEVLKYGEDQISIEKTRIGGAIIDAVVKHKSSYTIIEAKTSSVGLRNIRQALGQIFEYAFLDHKVNIEKLVIVGPALLTPSEKEYFNRLASMMKVGLEYWAYQSDKENINEKFLVQ